MIIGASLEDTFNGLSSETHRQLESDFVPQDPTFSNRQKIACIKAQ